MEATKTFTLTIPLDGEMDRGAIALALKGAANALIAGDRIFRSLPDTGAVRDLDDKQIATWEVR